MDVLINNKKHLADCMKQTAKRFSPNRKAIRFCGKNIIAPFGEKCKTMCQYDSIITFFNERRTSLCPKKNMPL